MYVCVCNAVRDTQIREALARGCNDLDGLSAELGVGNGCGTCIEYARAMIEAQQEQSHESPAFYAA